MLFFFAPYWHRAPRLPPFVWGGRRADLWAADAQSISVSPLGNLRCMGGRRAQSLAPRIPERAQYCLGNPGAGWGSPTSSPFGRVSPGVFHVEVGRADGTGLRIAIPWCVVSAPVAWQLRSTLSRIASVEDPDSRSRAESGTHPTDACIGFRRPSDSGLMSAAAT